MATEKKYPTSIAISSTGEVDVIISENEGLHFRHKQSFVEINPDCIIIDYETLPLDKYSSKTYQALIALENTISDSGPISKLFHALYRAGVTHGIDIGTDQCTLVQWRMERAYENFTDPETLSNNLEAPIEHMVASFQELEMLREAFPAKDIDNHHVKCPACWRHYMNLKTQYEGG